ncbi:MAG: FAD-binding oxidoreductase [Burkholderiales bacterium]|jgi:FAD/FMN-containing dehydrogenase|nr:FAD-binding oxidoreductase [Burkholderiales bacterium]
MQTEILAEHAARSARAAAQLRGLHAAASDAPLRLAKHTSNLFRDRAAVRRRLDLSALCRVLAIDRAQMQFDAEGLTSYEDLVAATLAQGCMPAVVPQLKTITVGGAVAGVGIEATSFRHGLVHDTMTELEVLLPDGEIVVASATNAHRDLFHGFPNSYGTLGYALRVRACLLPVKPCVHVRHLRHSDPAAFFADLAVHCAGDADFVDGVVFGPHEQVLSVARFGDAPPPRRPTVSDYTFENIYYRSLRQRDEDVLSAAGYLWRWDTDWFWCSKNVGAQHPLLRRLYGRKRLGSRTYTRLMRLDARLGLTRTLGRLRGLHAESVIQDVDIPLPRAAEFLDFLLAEVGVLPIWVCPIGPVPRRTDFTLYPLQRDTLTLNFGFWDAVRTREPWPAGHLNRKIEAKVIELGGIKSLYSDSYFDRDTFARAYNLDAYERLKRKYDPAGRLPGLYEKCVLRV